jgi:hypothetical protein
VAIAGFALIAVATLTGAFLALLVIAPLHLLPDAWLAVGAARIWPGIVPAAALGSFVLSGLAARRGCTCDTPDQARLLSTPDK